MLSGPSTLTLGATIWNAVNSKPTPDHVVDSVLPGLLISCVLEILHRTGWSVLSWVLSAPLCILVACVIAINTSHYFSFF